ncbi:MAG: S1C family serine protease, partial [Pirellulales bacterium]
NGTFSDAIADTQPKIVKIYGAGGFRGLEPYQSGMLVSSEGHVLTVWSYVLDTDYITVTLNDGRRFEAELVAADPRLELAVLKIDAEDLPHFSLNESVEAPAGTRVLAFSNLYGVATGDEAASVQHGSIAVVTNLEARHGAFETPYNGPVHVLDAMTNNPGAAGGVLTNRRGELLGMLGKELRNSLNNTWLNYSIPIGELAPTVNQMILGEYEGSLTENAGEQQSDYPLSLDLLGVVLVPNVLERTPPFIDQVRSDTPAYAAGLRPDDLLIFVNGRLVQSCNALLDELTYIDRADPVEISVMRNNEFLEFTLQAAPDQEGGR